MQKQKKTPKFIALFVGLVCLLTSVVAMATPPPIEIALAAVGEQASERRGASWQLTRVDDGIRELCALPISSPDDEVIFRGTSQTGDSLELAACPEAEAPWGLLWTLIWSTEPAKSLGAFKNDWGDETARFELVDGEPAQCYGKQTRLCLDLKAKRIVTLEVEIQQKKWRLRSARQGDSVQISSDGTQIARLQRGECF